MTPIRLILSTALLLGIGGATACVSSDPIDNDCTAATLKDAGSDDEEDDEEKATTDDDDEPVAVKDAGKAPTTVKDAGKAPTTVKDAGKTEPTEPGGEGQEPTETADGGTPPATTTDAGTTEPTEPTEPAEPTEPIMSVVPGSATKAKCSSYGKASGTMCAGYFCGVTLEQIEAEMPKDNICGENAVQGACDNKLPTELAKCARSVKSANALASNDELRPKVRDCVFMNAELKEKTPLPCMDCFLDAAICAGDKCLIDCLAGDSKGCDSCRAKNKCDAMVFSCAGLISPF